MSRVGDTPWVCPSCANHLGGYGRQSKGSEVIGHVSYVAPITGKTQRVDYCQCLDCGVVFTVDTQTVPVD